MELEHTGRAQEGYPFAHKWNTTFRSDWAHTSFMWLKNSKSGDTVSPLCRWYISSYIWRDMLGSGANLPGFLAWVARNLHWRIGGFLVEYLHWFDAGGTPLFIQAVHSIPTCPNARLVTVVALQEDGKTWWKYADPPDVKWTLVDNHQEGPGPHWVWVAPKCLQLPGVGCLWWNCFKESFHPNSGNSVLGCASHPCSGASQVAPATFPQRRTFLIPMNGCFHWTAVFLSNLVLPMHCGHAKVTSCNGSNLGNYAWSAHALSYHGDRSLLFYGWALLPLPSSGPPTISL